MTIDFNKNMDGLVPVIIQHANTLQVLMLGYMNEEAFEKTKRDGLVTFYSRSKQRLWTKGESSNNFLRVKDILIDCDNDTLLVKALPDGPTCHTGSISCFQENTPKGFIYELEHIVEKKINEKEEGSYTYKIFAKGVNKIAQKVGEEAVELVIESKDQNDDLFINEAADLIYHLMILLQYKRLTFSDIERELMRRNK